MDPKLVQLLPKNRSMVCIYSAVSKCIACYVTMSNGKLHNAFRTLSQFMNSLQIVVYVKLSVTMSKDVTCNVSLKSTDNSILKVLDLLNWQKCMSW